MKAHLLPALLALLWRMAQAFPDPRPRPKVLDLALGWLCGSSPKTVTSALDWLDQRQQDWSAAYRLLSQDHWEASAFFAPVLAEAFAWSGDAASPIYAAQDDTLLRKSGRKIPGTAYARDPLSPAFQVNLVWGQRFLQTALLVSLRVFADQRTEAFEPLPAWRQQAPLRPSVRDLITLLRKEACGGLVGCSCGVHAALRNRSAAPLARRMNPGGHRTPHERRAGMPALPCPKTGARASARRGSRCRTGGRARRGFPRTPGGLCGRSCGVNAALRRRHG